MKPQGQWTAEESAQEADRQRLIERSATPKPRAGEHAETDAEARRFADGDYMADYVPASFSRKLEAERDLLREHERELVEALYSLIDVAGNAAAPTAQARTKALSMARALLAKHGR